MLRETVFFNGRLLKGGDIDMDKHQYGYHKDAITIETFDFKGVYITIESKNKNDKKVTIIIDRAIYTINTEERSLVVNKKYNNFLIDESHVRIEEDNKITMFLDKEIAKKCFINDIELTDSNNQKIIIKVLG